MLIILVVTIVFSLINLSDAFYSKNNLKQKRIDLFAGIIFAGIACLLIKFL